MFVSMEGEPRKGTVTGRRIKRFEQLIDAILRRVWETVMVTDVTDTETIAGMHIIRTTTKLMDKLLCEILAGNYKGYIDVAAIPKRGTLLLLVDRPKNYLQLKGVVTDDEYTTDSVPLESGGETIYLELNRF